jgi:hypothetical protein
MGESVKMSCGRPSMAARRYRVQVGEALKHRLTCKFFPGFDRPVREGVSTDSLKFHPALPCPTLLSPAGGPPLKRPYGCLRPSSSLLDTPSRMGLLPCLGALLEGPEDDGAVGGGARHLQHVRRRSVRAEGHRVHPRRVTWG